MKSSREGKGIFLILLLLFVYFNLGILFIHACQVLKYPMLTFKHHLFNHHHYYFLFSLFPFPFWPYIKIYINIIFQSLIPLFLLLLLFSLSLYLTNLLCNLPPLPLLTCFSILVHLLGTIIILFLSMLKLLYI